MSPCCCSVSEASGRCVIRNNWALSGRSDSVASRLCSHSCVNVPHVAEVHTVVANAERLRAWSASHFTATWSLGVFKELIVSILFVGSEASRPDVVIVLLLVDWVETGVTRGGARISILPRSDSIVRQCVDCVARYALIEGVQVATSVHVVICGEVAGAGSRGRKRKNSGKAERFHDSFWNFWFIQLLNSIPNRFGNA